MKQCTEKRPNEKHGFKIIETSTNDGCCKSYSYVPFDCDTSKCQFQPPSCSFCEDLVTYSIDECCSTYECKCNPSLCPELGDLPCPTGSVRVIIDSDSCCAAGKCLRDPSFKVAASANSFASTIGGGLLTTFTSETGGNTGDAEVNMVSSGKLQAHGAASTSGSFELEAETAFCVDNKGQERKYGDCWYEKSDTCKSCTCYDASKIRLACYV